MAKIVIKGAKPYDGEYDLDLERAWTTREFHWIRLISGYQRVEIPTGIEGNDPTLLLAFGVIAMARNSKIERDAFMEAAEVLMDADANAIQIVIGDEDDAGPPDLTRDPDAPSANGTPSQISSSGDPSKPSSVPSDENPLPTGTSESGWQDTLAPTTLVKRPPRT